MIGLTMTMMIFPASATNSYSYTSPVTGNFYQATSTEPVPVWDNSITGNGDISKNSAFIPPAFADTLADVLGTGELLTPDIAGIEPMFPHSTQATFAPQVTQTGMGITGSDEIVLPPDVPGVTVSDAPVYDDAVTLVGTAIDGSLGGYTGSGAPVGAGAGYTAVNGMTRADGSIGTLVIDKIGVNRKVYHGETTANMRLGAAHFENTSAWNGNVALCGHNRGSYGYFSRIHELQNGDLIRYTTVYGTRTYQVYSVRKIGVTQTEVLDAAAQNIITLITCVRDVPSQRWCVQAVEV